jgi:hypothetical protein
MGLDPDRWYVTPRGGRWDRSEGAFVTSRRMPPWSTYLMEVTSISQNALPGAKEARS